MSDLDGYPDDMSDHLTDDQAERLLGGGPNEDLAPSLIDFVAEVRDLGTEPVDDALAAIHVAAAAGAVGDPWVDPAPTRTTRRFVLPRPALVTGLALLVLVGFGGLGTVAHASAPGDPLYGLDRALESIGIGDGGLAERATEAAEIANTDLGLAVETALAGLGDESDLSETDRADAFEALTAAAAAIEGRRAPVQDEVSALLRALAEDDAKVSEIARNIRRAVELPDTAVADPDPERGPAEDSPSEEAPGRDRGEPPSDRGPSDTGSDNGRTPDELPADGGSPPGRTP